MSDGVHRTTQAVLKTQGQSSFELTKLALYWCLQKISNPIQFSTYSALSTPQYSCLQGSFWTRILDFHINNFGSHSSIAFVRTLGSDTLMQQAYGNYFDASSDLGIVAAAYEDGSFDIGSGNNLTGPQNEWEVHKKTLEVVEGSFWTNQMYFYILTIGFIVYS